MANFERGVYEPSDEVRVFDAAEDDEDTEGSRLPLLIVLALLVLAMFGGVVWLAYIHGVAKGRGETPVLTAAAGPERVAPQQPGGANVPYQGFKIYEQPAPQDDAADSAAPAAPASDTATKSAVNPPAPPVETKPQAQVAPRLAPAKPEPAKLEPAKPEPSRQVATIPPPKPVAAPVRQAAVAPAAPTILGPATGAPRQLGTPAAASSGPSSAASGATSGGGGRSSALAAKAGGGTYVLQIGAYKSQAEAEAAWKTYKAKHGALLSGYADDVQQADLGEKGTWYRLRIGGMADRDGALALCDRLKADGGGCFLGK